MIKWLDLGMSDPLTLGMAHPLADRLETLAAPKANKTLSRGLTAALILAVGTLTAPLTIAEAHPEHTLPDTVINVKKKNSVIELVRTGEDGETVKKRYEIKLDGDTFEAYEVDVAGRKTKIDPSEIEGFDLEKAKQSKSWSFEVTDDNKLKFLTGKDIARSKGVYGVLHADKDFPSAHKSIRVFTGSDKLKEALGGLDALDLDENHQTIRVFKADKELKEMFKGLEGLEGLEKLEALEQLKALEGLEGLEALENLEGLKVIENLQGKILIETMKNGDGPKSFEWSGDFSEFPEKFKNFNFDHDFSVEFDDKNAFFFKHGEKSSKEARLAIAKSMLENAQNMLEDLDDLEESGSELRRAKRDLEKAQKALKDAEKKLEGKYPK